MSAADPAERPRSHTLERLFAACAVMAACLTGGIGLSAISRNFLEQRAPAENAMFESASPPATAAEAVQAEQLQADQLRAEQLEAQELAARRAGSAEEAAHLNRELELQIAQVRRVEELERQQRQGMDSAQNGQISFGSPPDRATETTPIPVSAGPSASPPPPVMAAGGEPDFNASPTYGTVSLSSGFTPDPYVTQLSAGGGFDASAVGASCRGFVASNPDLRVNYQAGAVSLYVFVESDADTTLLVNAPDGSWHCAAAAPGRGPLLAFEHPQSGQYDIWVGAHSATALSPATLRISEVGGQ
ncbi:MAG: hypothetical protein JNJ63_01975 [Hyphomonadaceae bacterium]|nr:hypothetical protein [Hyphomonadaceae bacterium]